MRVGEVFYVHCSLLFGPPKFKYLALVCSEAPIRVALINTENTAVVVNDAALGPTQVRLKKVEHPFLDYDSWLDFSRLVSGDTLGLEDETTWVGELSGDALQAALQAIEASPTLTPRQQQRSIESLKLEIDLRAEEASKKLAP